MRDKQFTSQSQQKRQKKKYIQEIHRHTHWPRLNENLIHELNTAYLHQHTET